MLRPLSKRTFQLTYAALLIGFVVTAIQLISTDSALYLPLKEAIGAVPGGFVLIIASTLVASLIGYPIRRLSRMPTLREELDKMGISSASELVARVQNDVRTAVNAPRTTLEEKRAHYRRQVFGSAAWALIFGIATAVNLMIDASLVFVAFPILAIACLIACALQFVKLVRLHKHAS